MDTKLTLKLDQKVIELAKEYAAQRKISLSRIIEAYLKSLTSTEEKSELEISPFIKSISEGGKTLPADLDYKKKYSQHLENKYK